MFPVILGALGLAAAAAASENNQQSESYGGRYKRFKQRMTNPPVNQDTVPQIVLGFESLSGIQKQQLQRLGLDMGGKLIALNGSIAILTIPSPYGTAFIAIWPDASGNYPVHLPARSSGLWFSYTGEESADYLDPKIPKPTGLHPSIRYFVRPRSMIPDQYGEDVAFRFR